jgi:hypothetical protein
VKDKRTDAPEGTRFLVLRDNHSAQAPERSACSISNNTTPKSKSNQPTKRATGGYNAAILQKEMNPNYKKIISPKHKSYQIKSSP